MVVDWTGVGCEKLYGGLVRKVRIEGDRGGLMDANALLGLARVSDDGLLLLLLASLEVLALLALLLARLRLRFLLFLDWFISCASASTDVISAGVTSALISAPPPGAEESLPPFFLDFLFFLLCLLSIIVAVVVVGRSSGCHGAEVSCCSSILCG